MVNIYNIEKEIKKVLIITNIPNPYRIPLFNEISKQLKENNIHLKVIFGSEGYSRRKFKLNFNEFQFDYEILSSRKFNFGNNEKTFFTYGGLLKILRNESPDKIIIAGFSFGTLKLWLRSFFKKTHYIIWSGSILKRGRNDSMLRIMQRKLLMKKANGFVAYGSKAKEYFISLGANSQNISIAINTVDTDFFFEQTKFLKQKSNPRNSKIHLTYIGYLSKRKNVIRLLSIIKELAKLRSDFVLDLIGDGDDKLNLEQYVQSNEINNYVRFHGFVEKERLPEFFSKSSVFLFQTDFDIWGLVLNEAMAAGVPCISSPNAGASFDLVKEGETGFIIEFSEKGKVLERINDMLDHPENTKRLGENASDFIRKNASIKKSAEGFAYAILNF